MQEVSTTSKQLPAQLHQKIVWQGGVPKIVSDRPVFQGGQSPVNLKALQEEALNLPYTGDIPEYVGLTKGEVLVLSLLEDATNGDKDARREVLDRIMGKATQNVKSVNINGTLADFLNDLDISGSGPMSVDDL